MRRIELRTGINDDLGIGHRFGGSSGAKYSLEDASYFQPLSRDDISGLVAQVRKVKAHQPLFGISEHFGTSSPVPRRGIAVNLGAHMKKILEIGPNYVVVESGAPYEAMDERLARQGKLFPMRPEKPNMTIGQMLSQDAAQPCSIRHGTMSDLIEELWVILSDGMEYSFRPLDESDLAQKISMHTLEGDIYRKMLDMNKAQNKEIPGLRYGGRRPDGKFDIARVFLGSHGSLGVITKAKLQTVKRPTHYSLGIIPIHDLDKLNDVLETAHRYSPDTIEVYDFDDHRLMARYAANQIAAGREPLKTALRMMTELLFLKNGRLPKAFIIAEFSGISHGECKHSADELIREMKGSFRIPARAIHGLEAGKVLRREAFRSARRREAEGGGYVENIKIAAKFSNRFISKLRKTIRDFDSQLPAYIGGYIGGDELTLKVVLQPKTDEQKEMAPWLAERIYKLTAAFGGTVAETRNGGRIDPEYLWACYGPETADMALQVKDTFDPLRIFFSPDGLHGSAAVVANYCKVRRS